MTLRIALLGINHESNTFIRRKTSPEDFRDYFWLKGEAIVRTFHDAHHELGGMIEVLEKNNVELVPVMYAAAPPGGIITAEAYSLLLSEMLTELGRALPVHGCLVAPHGAAVSEEFEDMDGHWLSSIRKMLGDEVMIVGSMDPHANASALMIDSTDALIAYKTNPHVDQRQTGVEAANLLLNCLMKKWRPRQTLLPLPLAISIDRQHTEAWPCDELFAFARDLSKPDGMLSVSVLFGFPYADVGDMGSAILAISTTSREQALEAAGKLREYILRDVDRFNSSREEVDVSMRRVQSSKKPVLMLDMGDNVGGGAPGDSAYLLRKFRQYGIRNYFICLQDPDAVKECLRYQPGDEFLLTQSRSLVREGLYDMQVRLIRITEGKFTEPDPRHEGLTDFNMGTIAILTTREGSAVLLTSIRTPPYSARQLTDFGIQPEIFDVIVAKGVNAPIAAYKDVCPTIIRVNSPGVTQADITRFPYSRRKKPMFPFEPVSLRNQ